MLSRLGTRIPSLIVSISEDQGGSYVYQILRVFKTSGSSVIITDSDDLGENWTYPEVIPKSMHPKRLKRLFDKGRVILSRNLGSEDEQKPFALIKSMQPPFNPDSFSNFTD